MPRMKVNKKSAWNEELHRLDEKIEVLDFTTAS
jgi:hypothetical protein